MAAKRRKSSGPRWQVILENIESLVRVNMEHLEMTRTSLEQRMDRLDHDLGTRVTSLEMAFHDLSGRFGTLDRKVDTLDRKVETLDRKVDTLDRKVETLFVPLDARVTAIEKRLD